MSGILFFIFASCEPLRHIVKEYTVNVSNLEISAFHAIRFLSTRFITVLARIQAHSLRGHNWMLLAHRP